MDYQDEILELLKTCSKTETARIIKAKYDLDVNDEAMRLRVRKIAKMVEPQEAIGEYREIHEYKDGLYIHDKLIEIMDGEPITPNSILKAHGLDAGLWEVVSYRNNYWHSQIKGGKRLVMYQSRISVKPKQNGLAFDEIDKHFEAMKGNPTHIEYKQRENGQTMAEVNIADLHFGKLCWHGDTGQNYDHKIAQSVFKSIVNEIYGELKDRQLEYILFVWTNDFFNSDTITKTTTGETPQDTDVRWQKLFNAGVDMIVYATDLFRTLAPVHMFYIPSNHDQMSGYYALRYISAWYKDCNGVEVNYDAFPRKYITYGNTLLGFTHGDKEGKESRSYEKASRLASLMPNEARDQWAKTKFHEMHVAHLHSEQMIQEINGVIVRRVASPTASDTWHTESGYVGSIRKAQTFIYDKERGLMQVINTPVEVT